MGESGPLATKSVQGFNALALPVFPGKPKVDSDLSSEPIIPLVFAHLDERIQSGSSAEFVNILLHYFAAGR